jgi:ParB/RepB/Spo0J family partition protein
MKHPTFTFVSIEEIAPSPTNPRRHFPEEYIKELASSIASRGIIQPLLVRSREDLPPPVGMRFELIAGECRLRASREAGLSEVPVIVRDDLSENDVVELQLIENLQRRDLDVLEEADSYAALLELSDGDRKRHSVESLAEAISKSIHYIHQRLSLRKLPDAAREAMRSGELSFSVARLVASIPSAPLRQKALDEVLHPTYEEEPLTARKAASHIREHYMIDLKSAPFDKEDPDLVPLESDEMGNRLHGGACSDCPWLSGNAKEADETTEGSKNLCMHPGCHSMKVDANWENIRAEALKAGKKVLSDGEAEKELNPWGGLVWSSNYVLLKDDVPAKDLADHSGKPPTWKKLLGSVEVKPEIVVIRDKGKALEVVDRRQAVAAIRLQAKKSGEVSPLRSRGDGDETPAQREAEKSDRAMEKLEQVIRHEMAHEAFNEIVMQFHQGRVDDSVLWPRLLDAALAQQGITSLSLVSKWLGLPDDSEETLRSELMKYPVGDAVSLAPYVLILLMAHDVQRECNYGETPLEGLLLKVLESLSIDPKGIEERVKASHADELKALVEASKPSKEKKKAGKKVAASEEVEA